MENIVWQNDHWKMFIRFDNNAIDKSTPTPCAFFIIGVERKYQSWIGGESLCRAEDSFSMLNNNLLSELGRMVNSYEAKILRIQDDSADTDGYVLFDCKLNCVKVSGQLGASFYSDFVANFEFVADASLLYNLYEVLKENTIC